MSFLKIDNQSIISTSLLKITLGNVITTFYNVKCFKILVKINLK